jgi:transcriptional regulator with XRE-family HTH domain
LFPEFNKTWRQKLKNSISQNLRSQEGELLEKALLKAGGIQSLARVINVTRQSVSAWLNGKSQPSLVQLAKVKDFYEREWPKQPF